MSKPPLRPQIGDRVRVVLEGTVSDVGFAGFTFGDYGIDMKSPEFVSVEKVAPPLPTTPGSVIRGNHTWILATDGLWASPTLPNDVRESGAWAEACEVIFDAGEVTS